jgi:hypothetical protein
LLLALPAYWLWRDCRGVRIGRRSSLQCLLSLGCLLVILFPVVSATDDLRAMRTEMEESPSSKRSISQKSGEKASSWKFQAQPLLAVASILFRISDAHWHFQPVVSFSVPPAPAIKPIGRAPPVSFLG